MIVEKSHDSHTNAKNTHWYLSISVVVTVDNRPIRLQLCDTAGQVRNLLAIKLYSRFSNVPLMILLLGRQVILAAVLWSGAANQVRVPTDKR